MSAFLEAVEKGHFLRSSDKKCRECDEPFPCSTIVEANQIDAKANRANRGRGTV